MQLGVPLSGELEIPSWKSSGPIDEEGKDHVFGGTSSR